MTMRRRDFVGISAVAAVAAPLAARHQASEETRTMYGLIGKMTAAPGQRDALAAILLEGTAAMPGCLSYVIATDPADADALWITEVWDDAASHKGTAADRRLRQPRRDRSPRRPRLDAEMRP
jgi:quinol monooxygenase YgiN